jgi:hypothetical protein
MPVTTLAASASLFDQPGTLGFLVVFGMAVVLYFVFRSMSRHMRKVTNAARQEAAAAESAASASNGANGMAASASTEDRNPR